MQNSFVLSFDLPKRMAIVRSRIHRKLVAIKAEKVHDSFWRSSNLKALIEIALTIKQFGGKAAILEEKFVF